MHAVLARVRAEYRHRWIAWVALTLVTGIGAGAVICLVAGARRTERAYPHLLDTQNSSDVLVAGKNSFGLVGSVDLDEVEKLPQVAETTRAVVSLLFAGRTSSGRRVGPVDVFPIAPEDTRLGRTIETWKMIEGRRADPNAVDEATASLVLAGNSTCTSVTPSGCTSCRRTPSVRSRSSCSRRSDPALPAPRARRRRGSTGSPTVPI